MTDTTTYTKPTTESDPGRAPESPVSDDAFAPITEINSANSTTSLAALGDRYLAWLDHKKDLQARVKDANEIIEKLERVIADRMIEEEFPQLPRRNKTIHLKTKTFASARAGKDAEIVAWMKANGHAPVLQERTNTEAVAAAMALAAGDIGAEDNPHLDEPTVKEVIMAKDLAAIVKEYDADGTGVIPPDLEELLNISRDRGLGVRTKAN